MYEWNQNRKLIYWGAGEVGRKCLSRYSHVRPQFILDSNPQEIADFHIKVINPDTIEDWKEYYIVITVENKSVIKGILEKKGLQENKDYKDYEVFFEIPASDSQGTLEYAKKQKENGRISAGKEIIAIPFYFSDRMNPVKHFFMDYINEHGTDNFLILHGVQYIDDQNMMKDFKCDLLPYRIPEIKHLREKVWQQKLCGLTDEELDVVKNIEMRKKNRNPVELIQLRYAYYKELFNILKPSSVIWWGGWARDTYIVKNIAYKQNFHFAVGEHGWLKGTINIDYEGIAGQSQFCHNISGIESLIAKQKYDRKYFYEIKKYLLASQKKEQIDAKEWEIVNNNISEKKTLLFIGMADYGMDMNPKSMYWKENISSWVHSTLDAVRKCAAICQKCGWNLIYKLHPKESKAQIIEDVKIPGVISVQNIPVELLIGLTDACISITSAVDFSVLLHDKPLIQLGKNSLNTAMCTYVVDKENELQRQMEAALKNGCTYIQKENYERHMLKLLRTVLWDDGTTRAVRYGRRKEEKIFDNQ